MNVFGGSSCCTVCKKSRSRAASTSTSRAVPMKTTGMSRFSAKVRLTGYDTGVSERFCLHLFSEGPQLTTKMRHRAKLLKRLSVASRMWLRRSPTGRQISDRESVVLESLLLGLSERKIAEQLKLSQHTIHAHVKSIYTKIGARGRAQMMAHVFAEILVTTKSKTSKNHRG